VTMKGGRGPRAWAAWTSGTRTAGAGLSLLRSTPLLGAIALLGVCDPFGMECTLIGCGNTLLVQLVGVEPEEEFAMTLHLEGEDPVAMQCDMSGQCTPLAPEPDFRPDEVTLTLELADTTITRTFEPDYDPYYPNGKDCGPECWAAELRFEVER